MKTYDAIIIGVGQAGSPLASTLSGKGWKTAVIERQHPGGSCVNYGCTPTKTMVASASVSHVVSTAAEVGIEATAPKTNFQQVIKRRDEIVKQWREGVEKTIFESDNIDYFFGEASFVSKKQIKVTLNEGGEEELTAEKIFINVGTSPRIPDIQGLNKIDYLTSKSMMDLKELPEHLIILGGSYIGLEFGQMYRRLGSKVSIIQNAKQLAPKEDQDIAAYIKEFLEEEGVDVYLNSELSKVEKSGANIVCSLEGQVNKTIKGSHLLLAIGTNPNTKNLKAEQSGITLAKHDYIEVNEYLETNVEGIFALGDCKGGPEFTHISYDDFRIVNDYLFGEKKRKISDRLVPYTMFTKPELGRVGLNEKMAKEQGIEYQIAQMPMSKAARAIEANETSGILKVLVSPEDKTILGASCLAEVGGEMMSMLEIAMMGGLTYEQLRDGIFAHPTYGETLNNLFASVEDPE
ncbi:mercuric reductase [Porifericola rhodea]|uniref:mercuric reductase n=1 Tax=Porifericola rhodea TaxID=930972 RepID=UPI0026660635|nr:mercuric reductase [Porifericola rhodea]WKN31412.1 mercuric reductase [Porifericola rhodea]